MYIAHKKDDRVQSMKDHLEGTAKLASNFAKAFGKEDYGYCVGLLHDIGKYSAEFQSKIANDTNAKVDHSTAGAKLCKDLGGMYALLSYAIAGHHAGLPNRGNTGVDSSLCGRLKKGVPDFSAYEDDIQVPAIATMPFTPSRNKNNDFALSVFIRMIYSCLVDADFLDTEYFMKDGTVSRNTGEPVVVLRDRLKKHISPWLSSTNTNSINARRSEILSHCIDMGSSDRGLFKLTVPTGGGKTISSLAFALEHAVKHGMDRVIYVIPYTSIIEQNAQVFRDILGDANVLEHHCNVEFRDGEELLDMQLASENWDKPIIVTTNVQFFESLYAHKSSKCRKLHNIANSVVIFDETQMLPTDYLIPCMAMIKELVDEYRVSAILCTATQPALGSLRSSYDNASPAWYSELLATYASAIELCPDVQKQFDFFRRVSYHYIKEKNQDEIVELLREKENALCIVNTKLLAQKIYESLKGDGVYHLSTSMVPLHRKKVLGEIRARLRSGKRCVLISTSLVEAGVDLDFQNVYRQIAGIDSIIQAAGRCNREGRRTPTDSNVFVFDIEGGRAVSSQGMQIGVARIILADYPDDIASLDAIEAYFSRLYGYKGESLDKKRILDMFKDKDYQFATASKTFYLIEQNTISIAIPRDDDGLLSEIKIKGVSKERMRRLGQISVQVYANNFEKLQGLGVLRPIHPDIENVYELISSDLYHDDIGLDLQVDEGVALFM